MSLEIDLKEIERKANYAAFQDGLMEICIGLFLFFYGGSLVTNTLPIGLVLIFIAVFLARPVIEHLKKRFIYPRTGYVKLPDDSHTTGRGIAAAAVVMVLALLGALGVSMIILGQDPGVVFFLTYIVPPASGFMLAIGPFWLGQTYGLRRGYVWAVLFVLGGLAMPVFGISVGYEAVGLLCTWMGLLILLTGLWMFIRFIRKYPAESIEIRESVDVS